MVKTVSKIAAFLAQNDGSQCLVYNGRVFAELVMEEQAELLARIQHLEEGIPVPAEPAEPVKPAELLAKIEPLKQSLSEPVKPDEPIAE